MVTKSEEQATILAQAQENLIRDNLSLEDEFSLIAQLTENGQREDVDPKDEGDALLALAGGKQSPGGDRKSNHYCTATMISQADLAKMLGGVSKSLSGNGTGSGDTLRH